MTSATAGPRRRADAERSIARIVAAARECLSGDPNTSLDEIAKAAGVGRMTLYGHFRTRAELVEATMVNAMREGERVLSAVDLGGDARAALARLLDSSWALVAEAQSLLAAAEGTLPPGRIREMHDAPARRVEDLISRGQREGVFRSDLPLTWLVNMVHYVMRCAADENRSGRLESDEAAGTVNATVQSILAPPA